MFTILSFTDLNSFVELPCCWVFYWRKNWQSSRYMPPKINWRNKVIWYKHYLWKLQKPNIIGYRVGRWLLGITFWSYSVILKSDYIMIMQWGLGGSQKLYSEESSKMEYLISNHVMTNDQMHRDDSKLMLAWGTLGACVFYGAQV